VTLPGAQIEVGAFLARLTGAPARETHISAVYVGAAAVYKLKKSAKLSFLDFSTLAARRDMARREVTLNRVAAPGIYRGVRAVCADGAGGFRLAPEDAADAVDYVVEMAPVPAADFFDEIASASGLTPGLLDGLGDCVAALHARLAPVPGCDSVGSLRRIAAGNAVAACDAGLDAARVEHWLARVLAAIEALAPALRQRAAAGLVRRAHGDLHLGNLCLWEGRPTAFDMLEFDEALATIDLGYDLAFLLMDLCVRVGRAAANRVMNRYVARTGDVGMLALLPVFLSLRAVIRAHVQAASGAAMDAARYLDFAEAALAPPPPVLLAIGGLQGSGKTCLARALAPGLGALPGALHLRSDEIRKRLAGVAPEDRLAAGFYTPGANARVNAALLDAAAAALAAGHAVIADSVFLHPGQRHAIEAVARAAHRPFHAAWLTVPLETALARVAGRVGDASDAGPEVLRAAAALETGVITWPALDASDGGAVLSALQARLGVPVDGSQ